ncbi:MAG: GNAT family N-acetyltransferase [Pirellulaceae bacterium]
MNTFCIWGGAAAPLTPGYGELRFQREKKRPLRCGGAVLGGCFERVLISFCRFVISGCDPLGSKGWKVKIRDKERLEPPHVTIFHGRKFWRLGLRDHEFLLPPGGKWKKIDPRLRAAIENEENWQRLCDEWEVAYPANPVSGIREDDEWRGREVGTALLRTLLEWAEAKPIIEKVCLEVFSTNERAIRRYRKLGFMKQGFGSKEVKRGPGEYVDVLWMYRFVKWV